MRISKEEAAANRAKVLAAAARLFREKGVDGIAVAELMQAAGLTHGGFYNHFPSKEALATAASAESLRRSNDGLAAALEEGGLSALRSYVGQYLSPRHRDHPDTGNTLAALSADAGRQGGCRASTEGTRPGTRD